MNPKNLNDLDPKLKETYERVMGTSFGNTTPPVASKMETQPAQPATQSIVEPRPQAEQQLQVETPTTSTNEGTTVSQVFRAENQSKASEPATVNSPSFKSETTKKTDGNKKSLLIITVIGVVVFLAVYAVIWAKVLGLF